MATLKQKEKALERAAKAQARYWDAVRALEQALGFDVEEGGPALEDCTVEYLEHEHGPQGGEEQEDDGTCSGGCGRPANECASSGGADYCADADDYLKHGKPKTWEAFEAKHFPAE